MDSGLQPTLAASRTSTSSSARSSTAALRRKVFAWLGDKLALCLIASLGYAGTFFVATKLDLVGVHKDQEAMSRQVTEYQRTTEAALAGLQQQISELRTYLLTHPGGHGP